jgi:ABC-type multidrug transport system fused ATPase/permease subunit
MTAPDYRSTLEYLRPFRARVALLGVVLVVAIGFELGAPLILQRFIDAALGSIVVESLTTLGILYLALAIGKQLLSAVATYLGADVGWRSTNELRADMAEHLIGLDMSYHTSTTPGELIERVDGDVTAVSQFIARFMVKLLGSGLLLAGALGVSWFTDWRMGLGISGYVLLVLALLARMRSMAVSAAEEERETSAQLYGFIEERLAGIEDIRANGGGAASMASFVPVSTDFFARTRTAWRKRAQFWVASNTAFWSGDIIALVMGVVLVSADAITVGTAFLLLQYTQLVRVPIEQVSQEFQELQKAAGGILRIDGIRRLRSTMRTGSGSLPSGALSVRFDKVHFSYDDKPVLSGVTFELGAGRTLGIVGRTGGGKTTITRLISRLYQPDAGLIELAGNPIDTVSEQALRRHVGVVTQDVQLFAASVRDNLTYFDHARTDEEILGTLRRAGLGAWIDDLGLDTEIGSDGGGLSAGESQLLAFARVFLQSPGLVLLDEPSSRLDPVTESLLAEATERLFAARTVVIVAHRLDTLRTVDEIMVVSDGAIVEHGERDALVANPESAFSAMVAAGEALT